MYYYSESALQSKAPVCRWVEASRCIYCRNDRRIWASSAHCEIDPFLLLVWQALLNISRDELEISAHCTQIEAQCEYVHVNGFQIIWASESPAVKCVIGWLWCSPCFHMITALGFIDWLWDSCVWIFFQRFQYDEKLEEERHIHIYIQLLLHICVVYFILYVQISIFFAKECKAFYFSKLILNLFGFMT